MIIQNSAKEIGQYNYTHWTDKPVTPGVHTMVTVPQTIADGWEAYCSCGEWRGFCSMYDVYEAMDVGKATFEALRVAFNKHVACYEEK